MLLAGQQAELQLRRGCACRYHDCEVSGIDGLCFFGDNIIFGSYLMNGKVCIQQLAQ